MTYAVKEAFRTIQGEGGQTGQVAVFLRFAGCNLWTGREKDRENAICQFCDTDFVGVDGENGGKFTDADALAAHVEQLWSNGIEEDGPRLVVCTGGEPLLQLDEPLIEALHDREFRVAVETNGTIACPDSVDWICVSPKAGSTLVQVSGQELKLVYPQPEFDPRTFEALDFERLYLQPMDGPEQEANTRKAVAFCRRNPRWRLSLQTHKFIGID